MANVFEYFQAVGDWGEYHTPIFEALTEISNIADLPEAFCVDYIKYKEGVGIRIEYENAGSKGDIVKGICERLEQQTV